MKKHKSFAILLVGTLALGCPAGPTYAAIPTEDLILETMPDLSPFEGEILASDSTKSSQNEVMITTQPRMIATINTDDVEDGAENFEKKVLYQTFDQEDSPTLHFPETISVHGQTYALKSADSPVYVKKEFITPKTLEFNGEVFAGDSDEHLPNELITDNDGNTYRLIEKTLKEQASNERIEYKESSVVYSAVEAGVQIPRQKDIEINDVDTKQKIQVLLDLKDTETVRTYWSEDFVFPITITGYDADVFLLNGQEIPKDADLADYVDDFLKYLKLDPDSYRITSIDWKNDAYEKDGELVRDAVAKGRKYVKDINATYGGEVKMPAIIGHMWECVYEEDIPENERTVYTMATNVVYEQLAAVVATEKSGSQKFLDKVVGMITAAYEAIIESFTEHPVISSIPLVIFAAFLTHLISRKIRNRCIYNNKIKCPHKKSNAEVCKGCVNYHNRNKV